MGRTHSRTNDWCERFQPNTCLHAQQHELSRRQTGQRSRAAPKSNGSTFLRPSRTCATAHSSYKRRQRHDARRSERGAVHGAMHKRGLRHGRLDDAPQLHISDLLGQDGQITTARFSLDHKRRVAALRFHVKQSLNRNSCVVCGLVCSMPCSRMQLNQ